MLERVGQFATAQLQRPVRLTTDDPDGQWQLAVHPGGQVEDLSDRPRGRRRGHDPGQRPKRRIATRLASLALLALVVGTGAFLIVQSQRGRSPEPTAAPAPKAPRRSADPPALRPTASTPDAKAAAAKLRRTRRELRLERRRGQRLTRDLEHTESQRGAWEQWARKFDRKRYGKLKQAAARREKSTPRP